MHGPVNIKSAQKEFPRIDRSHISLQLYPSLHTIYVYTPAFF